MDLKSFIESIEKQKLDVEGIVVFQGGRESASHRWEPEQRRNVHSVAKSFASIAIGMAIDEGKLALSDKVTGILKRETPDKAWDALNLENLLTMSMGHFRFSRPRSVKEALSYKLSYFPGTHFLYDNTCTFLASAMLTSVTGLKMRDYLESKLFGPLGIPYLRWDESDDGYTVAATGLYLSTSEMALFGQFLLQRGNWRGRQLVSSAWIDRATRTQVMSGSGQGKPDYRLGYGYQFWTCRHGAFRCDGRDGQYIVVFPGRDAVVAINSHEENQEPILQAVWDFILPVLKI